MVSTPVGVLPPLLTLSPSTNIFWEWLCESNYRMEFSKWLPDVVAKISLQSQFIVLESKRICQFIWCWMGIVWEYHRLLAIGTKFIMVLTNEEHYPVKHHRFYHHDPNLTFPYLLPASHTSARTYQHTDHNSLHPLHTPQLVTPIIHTHAVLPSQTCTLTTPSHTSRIITPTRYIPTNYSHLTTQHSQHPSRNSSFTATNVINRDTFNNNVTLHPNKSRETRIDYCYQNMKILLLKPFNQS